MKNDLIKIGIQQEQPAVNARCLWRFLESKRSFSNGIKTRIETYRFQDGSGFETFLAKSAEKKHSILARHSS